MNFVLDIILNNFCPGVQYHGPGSGFFDRWPHMMPFGGLFMWIILILIVVILIAFISKRGSTSSEKNVFPREENPLDILKKRYAKGEIDREEFERIKKDIE